MTLFYLIRHGETEHNAQNNAYCGRSDVLLNDMGHKQSEALAEKLKMIDFSACYTSPLKRAKQTMEYLTEDYKTDSRLLEIDFGNWEGYTKEVISEKFSSNWNAWQHKDSAEIRAGENGETRREAYNRIKSMIDETVKKYPNANVLIVAHNTIIRLLLTGLFEANWSNYRSFVCNNTSIAILDIDHGKFSLNKINDDSHLVKEG